jgi:hydrogenase-4 component B
MSGGGAGIWLRVLLVAYPAGASAALMVRGSIGRAVVAAAAAIGSTAGFILAATVLAGGEPAQWALAFPLTPLVFRLDPLGAFFLVVTTVVGFAASIFSFGYGAGGDRRVLRTTGVNLNLLLLGLSLQVMADNPLTFLLVWELMSLAAYFLVLAEPDKPGAVNAATWYFSVTHAGFAALVAMFFLWSGGALTSSFAELRGVELHGALRDAVFVLALVGFGTKAGIMPLHIWLPRAHPVAPSHASALMSGVVLKMGVYGLVRVAFDLLGGGPAWWGMLVLALGTVSALMGVLYALMQHDLKRLLAYHSIENIGIIFMGIGTALLFRTYGLPLLAALALAAALYHTLNHACFKGLLFLGAGAVVRATHTRNIEEMGGLIRRMPRTAFAFLIGSAAISTLPPLNGFASEWLLFQSLLGGARFPAQSVAVLMPVGVGLLALSSGLAAACFVKAFGITFLAIPRSPQAESAEEAPRSMQAGMFLLVAACVGLGLGPALVVPLLGRVIARLPGLEPAVALRAANGALTGMPDGLGQMSLPAVAVGLVAITLIVWIVLRVLAPPFRMRQGATWGCGRLVQTPRMQYTATSFAEPLRRVFAQLYRPTEDLTVEVHPDSEYFIRAMRYESRVHPWVERLLYLPLLAMVRRAGRRVRQVQGGSVHLYLAYMCGALLILLLVARWLP